MQKLTPQFAYMKGMPIATRVKWILIVAAVGFALQLFVSPVPGLVLYPRRGVDGDDGEQVQ